jgi:probable selenium-dependent hydroxylase accessory protein YqeC
VAGIILAAGLSRRFGTNKLITSFRGKPLLQWTVEAALRSRLASVNVVLGHEHRQVASALAALSGDSRLTITINDSFAQGQSTSIVAGLAAISPDNDAAMLMVGDQPLIDDSVINLLISTFATSNAGICFPCIANRRGNPVIFSSRFFPELVRLTGDTGGRTIMERHAEACVPVVFSSASPFSDVDVPSDLDALRSGAADATVDLVTSLNLQDSRVIALCGAGGKTALLSALVPAFARNASEQILATTTTKFGSDEANGPWRACRVANAEAILALGARYTGPVLAYRDRHRDRDRLLGFSSNTIDAVARTRCYTRIIVEADGSRRRPLKAPDSHEPVLPASADTVITVAGLSGLGRLLDDAAVFRPQIWSALSGQTCGVPITPQALARVIVHPDGLMRGAPPHAKRLIFLNQADSAERQALALAVVDALAAMQARPALEVAIGQLQPAIALHGICHLAAGA